MPAKTRAQSDKKKKQPGQTWKKYLKNIYYSPSHPASFQGIDKIYDIVKEEKLYHISRKQVEQWLHDQHSFSINKPVLRKFKRSRVLVSGQYDQFDVDLIVVPKYAYANNGVQYILVAVDVLSRYAWVTTLKNKTGQLVKKGFMRIFAQGRKPNMIRSDRGSEFTNKIIKDFFHRENINIVHFFTSNEKQANYAERFIKTLKVKMKRYMTHNVTDKYIDVLQPLVRSYNTTHHKSINEQPININETNEKKLWWETYWPKEPYREQDRKKWKRRVNFKFKKGDLVRMTQVRRTIEREYDERWTGEVFRIVGRFVRQRQAIYKLTDYAGEKMEGTYYEIELQKVTVPEKDLFIVEEELGERTHKGQKQILVKWKYFPKKFNQWIAKDKLKIK